MKNLAWIVISLTLITQQVQASSENTGTSVEIKEGGAVTDRKSVV